MQRRSGNDERTKEHGLRGRITLGLPWDYGGLSGMKVLVLLNFAGVKK